MRLQLNPALDNTSLHEAFARQGYVHVKKILSAPNADAIALCLRDHTGWNLVFNQGGRHYDMDGSQAASLSPHDLERLTAAVYAQARDKFQYFYRNMPIYDQCAQAFDPANVLHRFTAWLNSAPFLEFARAVTGAGDIRFADAQATCFEPGHFLSTHDDAASGKNRRAAFVFNFTPHWRSDWGGYLQLHAQGGDIRRGLRPSFNALNIIAVPQPHSVGLVAPFAGARRLAITGWLRSGSPEVNFPPLPD